MSKQKILSMLAVGAMVCSMSVPALAAESVPMTLINIKATESTESIPATVVPFSDIKTGTFEVTDSIECIPATAIEDGNVQMTKIVLDDKDVVDEKNTTEAALLTSAFVFTIVEKEDGTKVLVDENGKEVGSVVPATKIVEMTKVILNNDEQNDKDSVPMIELVPATEK